MSDQTKRSSSVDTKDNNERAFFVTLFGLLLICLISYGATVSVIGFLLEPIGQAFGQSMGSISVIVSMIFLVPAFTTPAISWILNRWGPKFVLVTGGMLAGSGYLIAFQIQGYEGILAAFFLVGLGLSGCGVVPCIMILNEWTERRRAFAAGVLFGSVALGSCIFPTIAEHIIVSHGWRAEALLTALLFIFGVVPLGLIFGRRPHAAPCDNKPAVAADTQGSKGILVAALRHPMFWAICSMEAVFSIGLVGAYIYAPLFFVDTGYASQTSAWIFSALNLVTIAGCVAIGALSDRYGAALALFAGLLVHVLALFLAQIAGQGALGMVGLGMFVLLWGLTNNIGFQLTPVLLGDQFGLQHCGAIYGVTRVAAGVSQAMGPIIAGFAYDVSGSYRSAFLVCAIIVSISLLPALYILRRLHTERRDMAVTLKQALEITT